MTDFITSAISEIGSAIDRRTIEIIVHVAKSAFAD
jgi:hypothetical protein